MKSNYYTMTEEEVESLKNLLPDDLDTEKNCTLFEEYNVKLHEILEKYRVLNEPYNKELLDMYQIEQEMCSKCANSVLKPTHIIIETVDGGYTSKSIFTCTKGFQMRSTGYCKGYVCKDAV